MKEIREEAEHNALSRATETSNARGGEERRAEEGVFSKKMQDRLATRIDKDA